MSNKSNPTISIEETPEFSEEFVVEAELVDAQPTTLNKVGSFLKKHKTKFMVTGAGVGGFFLHAFLSDRYPLDEIEYEDDEDTVAIEA